MQELSPINSSIDPVTFFFEKHEVRVIVDRSGTPWFVCRDVFAALDVSWSGRKASLKNYPKRWVRVLQCQTPQGVQDMICMSQPGIYKTLFNSRKPQAEAFVEFVCEELLPTLQKQGFFGKLQGADRARMSRELRQLLTELPKADAFQRELLLRDLRCVCGLLGYPVPDTALIGKDPDQLALEGL